MAEALHMYVDESTQHDYLVIAACVPANRAPILRTELRGLLLPKQRSLHMKDETPARRKLILETIRGIDIDVLVYGAKPSDHGSHAKARSACIRRLAFDAVNFNVQRLVLDRNDTTEQRDKSDIIQGASKAGGQPVPYPYHHAPRHSEPLLWMPDAVGWSWAKGGSWKQLVTPLVTQFQL